MAPQPTLRNDSNMGLTTPRPRRRTRNTHNEDNDVSEDSSNMDISFNKKDSSGSSTHSPSMTSKKLGEHGERQALDVDEAESPWKTRLEDTGLRYTAAPEGQFKATKFLNYPRLHWFLGLFRENTPYRGSSKSRLKRGSLAQRHQHSTGSFPSGAHVRTVSHRNSAALVTTSIMIFALFIRWCISLNGYSGKNVPPMYGDFEAQRHWLEITTGLEISKWYYYDDKYWPLDYPPLTAFHSYICGVVAQVLNKSWVELDVSRGIETASVISFMRTTVFIFDFLIYFTACFKFVNTYLPHRGKRKQVSSYSGQTLLIILLVSAPMIIIDHGHFQYNCIMLGLTLWSINFMLMNQIFEASILFSLALLFKQMALFYAIPYFFCILGVAVKRATGPLPLASWVKSNDEQKTTLSYPTEMTNEEFFLYDDIGVYYTLSPFTFNDTKSKYARTLRTANSASDLTVNDYFTTKSFWSALVFIIKVGLSVLATFSLLLLPFVIYGEHSWATEIHQIFRRVFPVHRGLFEDKVANFWCSINIFIKIRNILELKHLMVASVFGTLVSVLPSSIHLFIHPTKKNFLYALLNGSLGFYMFSFQVHEKSILIPLLPSILLSLDDPQIVTWFSNVAMFSMYPLLKRDELSIPYVLLLILTNFLLGGGNAFVRSNSSSSRITSATDNGKAAHTNGVLTTYTQLVDITMGTGLTKCILTGESPVLRFVKRTDTWATWGRLTLGWYVAATLVHFLELVVPPPERLPDIYVVANLELSFAAFVVILVYFNMRQLAHR